LNSITHWLDGSIVYGSDEAQLATLRSGLNGLLKTSESNEGKELLPLWPSCSEPTCYYAGDVRAQENPQLAVLHTIWMRQHNRMARALAVVNPHWDDERLFQETRRIVIAQLQHITYNEYLPAMLGKFSRF
jgi:peroxidase